MLIYLDLCCFNRPWDDQSSLRIRVETEAKLHLQEFVRAGKARLVWSYVLSYENSLNPFRERRESIEAWRQLAAATVEGSDRVIAAAEALQASGAGAFDALHVACAVEVGAALFVTTDDRLRRLLRRESIIEAQLPQEALATLEHWYEN